MPEVRPFFQKAMLLSEVGWHTPTFLSSGLEEPNEALSPGSEMKWTPMYLGNKTHAIFCPLGILSWKDFLSVFNIYKITRTGLLDSFA